MPSKKSQVVVCSYRVRKGKEPEFLKLIRKHGNMLRQLGLVADEPRMILRGLGLEGSRRSDFIELMAWKTGAALEAARKSPEVLSQWERLEQLCEERDGRPATEFPHYEAL